MTSFGLLAGLSVLLAKQEEKRKQSLVAQGGHSIFSVGWGRGWQVQGLPELQREAKACLGSLDSILMAAPTSSNEHSSLSTLQCWHYKCVPPCLALHHSVVIRILHKMNSTFAFYCKHVRGLTQNAFNLCVGKHRSGWGMASYNLISTLQLRCFSFMIWDSAQMLHAQVGCSCCMQCFSPGCTWWPPTYSRSPCTATLLTLTLTSI